MARFREAYPTTTVVLMCDSGCMNYTAAAAALGAVYHPKPLELSTKHLGGLYISRVQIMTVLHALRDAVAEIREPFFMQMEDDVRVLRPVRSALRHDINGVLPPHLAYFVGGPRVWALKRNPALRWPDDYQVPLGGLGGCILRTSFWQRVLNLPSLEAEMDDMFTYATTHGIDYVLTTLAYAFNGTVGPFDGYAHGRYAHTEAALEAGTVEVFHGDKSLYSVGELTPSDLAILGPHYNT